MNKFYEDYLGAPVHQVPELKSRSCMGCCFGDNRDFRCEHVKTFKCHDYKSICVRDLDAYAVAKVTFKLTGETK